MSLHKASPETLSPVNIEGRFFSFEIDAEGNIISQKPVHGPGSANTQITSGLVDMQVNGFAGIDYNDPGLDPAAFEQSLEAMLATGVTACLPTLISGSVEHLEASFYALEKARKASDLARSMVVGYHLEGPFLSPEQGFRGCHRPEAMIAADYGLFQKWQEAAGGNIRLITVAPEIEGVLSLIERVSSRGVLVALGHTAADAEMIRKAVDAGAVLSTHLGNGTSGELSKHDNPILTQLAEDRLSASFIADGYHLCRDHLKIYLRAKKASRTLLISDSTAASSAPPGRYRLGQLKLKRGQEPVAYAPGTGRPAGSAVTLDQCVRNVMDWYDLPLEEAVSWAGLHPMLLLNDTKHSLNEFKSARFVWWGRTKNEWRVKAARAGAFIIQNQ